MSEADLISVARALEHHANCEECQRRFHVAVYVRPRLRVARRRVCSR